jgi:hypothetical protein
MMSVRSPKQTSSSSDRVKLHKTLQGVIGKRCWKVAFGYGGELRLHLGARIPYASPKLAGQKKESGGSDRAERNGCYQRRTASFTRTKGRNGFKGKEPRRSRGGRLFDLQVIPPSDALVLGFSNRCLVFLTPSAEDEKYDLPYWEMFMPNGMLVAYGPGKKWSCKRSDLPISD